MNPAKNAVSGNGIRHEEWSGPVQRSKKQEIAGPVPVYRFCYLLSFYLCKDLRNSGPKHYNMSLAAVGSGAAVSRRTA